VKDEPIWAQEYPAVSAELMDNGASLRLTLTRGRGERIWVDIEAGDAVELMDALNDWLTGDGA
jgi:tRNA threonylcarbamoyladenosine modification (KEOPS) complex  Pcc1 subunit